jgi:hypothetical protein
MLIHSHLDLLLFLLGAARRRARGVHTCGSPISHPHSTPPFNTPI